MKKRIAVIDNQIFPCSVQALCGQKIQTLKVQNGICMADSSPYFSHTHGTVCASLAGEFLPGMDLVGISTAEKGIIDISNVCTALQWCLGEEIAAVCLSMGVTCGLGQETLARTTRLLAEQEVLLFCACSNDGKLTFPAAYPWTIGVAYDPNIQGVFQMDSRWGYDITVGFFQSNILDSLARGNAFFHTRTNSLAVAFAARQILQAGGVQYLPVLQRNLWTVDVGPAFEKWEKPVVMLRNSREKWEPLFRQFSQRGYWPALLTAREATDWSKMTARVRNLGEAAALIPLLEEVGILFLDVPESEVQVWDLELDLSQCSAEDACCQVMKFFGEEEST